MTDTPSSVLSRRTALLRRRVGWEPTQGRPPEDWCKSVGGSGIAVLRCIEPGEFTKYRDGGWTAGVTTNDDDVTGMNCSGECRPDRPMDECLSTVVGDYYCDGRGCGGS